MTTKPDMKTKKQHATTPSNKETYAATVKLFIAQLNNLLKAFLFKDNLANSLKEITYATAKGAVFLYVVGETATKYLVKLKTNVSPNDKRVLSTELRSI